MKKVSLLIICILQYINVLFATEQQPEILFYHGEKLYIYTLPLRPYLIANKVNICSYFNEDVDINTGCWRGYIGTWKIEHDSLFLEKVRACGSNEKGIIPEIELMRVFGNKYSNNRVFADWVSDTLFVPFGKELVYLRMNYEYIYEFEHKFIIKKGIINKYEKLDNSKTHLSIFTSENNIDRLNRRKSKQYSYLIEANKDTLYKYLNTKIDWSVLPHVSKDSVIEISLSYSADENGVIDSVILEDSVKNDFAKEAVRIIKTISPWDIFYRHGKYYRQSAYYTVTFIQPIDSVEHVALVERDNLIGKYSMEQKLHIIKQRERIDDSICLIYYKEKRDKQFRKYYFSYVFVDYTSNNKYTNKLMHKSVPNPALISYGQKENIIKHFNISKFINQYWAPIKYYEGLLCNCTCNRRLFEFTDSTVYMNNMKLVEDFKVLDKNHFKISLFCFTGRDTIDVHFLDEEHKFAIFASNGRYELFIDLEKRGSFPIVTYNYDRESDFYNIERKMDEQFEMLPKDINLLLLRLKDVIKKQSLLN